MPLHSCYSSCDLSQYLLFALWFTPAPFFWVYGKMHVWLPPTPVLWHPIDAHGWWSTPTWQHPQLVPARKYLSQISDPILAPIWWPNPRKIHLVSFAAQTFPATLSLGTKSHGKPHSSEILPAAQHTSCSFPCCRLPPLEDKAVQSTNHAQSIYPPVPSYGNHLNPCNPNVLCFVVLRAADAVQQYLFW